MKAFTVVAALSFALLTVPALAQQKPPAKPPATPPAQPIQKPAAPTPAPAAQPPRPFPEGAKIAYFSPQQIVNDSREGKAGSAQIKAFTDKKVKEIQDKQKELETDQTMVNSPTLADDKRGKLQKDIDRLNVEIQRMQQDAQQEMQEMQNELQQAFQKRMFPIVQQLAQEKGLQFVLIADPNLIYWVDTGLDLSAEIVKRMDAAGPATTPK